MPRELGDHIGKKKGWFWYELAELAVLLVNKIKWKKKDKQVPVKNEVPDDYSPDNEIR